jgi:hypothetical protein
MTGCDARTESRDITGGPVFQKAVTESSMKKWEGNFTFVLNKLFVDRTAPQILKHPAPFSQLAIRCAERSERSELVSDSSNSDETAARRDLLRVHDV